MNHIPSTSASEPLTPPIPIQKKSRGGRIVLAFFLGLIAFVLLFNLAEAFGVYASYIGMAAVCFILQYLLSRGNPRAVRQDWPMILAMNSLSLFVGIMALLLEPNRGAALEGALIAPFGIAGAFVGAAVAARAARK